MPILHIIAITMTLTGLAAWLNAKYIKLPTNIGILLVSTAISVALVILNKIGFYDISHVSLILREIDFEEFVLHGILSILLFAGALHVDIQKLKKYKWNITLFATLGVILATIITGYIIYFTSTFLGVNLPLIYCLIFGALIAPTDPVAVLSILNSATKNEALKTKLAGESLFNDGTGIVLFMLLLGLAFSNNGEFSFATIDYSDIVISLIKEIFGGLIIGLVCAFVAMMFIKSVDSFEAEIIITIALAIGSYSIAEVFHFSAPIAAVVAGLFMGNRGIHISMTEKTKEHVVTFWTLLDEIFNSILFFLIGIEIILFTVDLNSLALGVLAIFAVLVGRYFSLLVCAVFLLKSKTGVNIKTTPLLMTWAGLRGGISVALALSIPNFEYKDLILGMTYIVVVFSVLVQGLTLKNVVKHFEKEETQ